MNRKKRKLYFIRSKNDMRRKGYNSPKWVLKNNTYPAQWINNSPEICEEAWIIDMRQITFPLTR